MLCVSPLFHVSGALPLASAAANGQKMVFPPVGKWDEVTHLQLTQDHHVGGWSGVPTQFWRLLEHPRFEEFDTTSVLSLGGGGATFPPELFKLVARKMPWARFGVGYGMSETLGSGSRLGGVNLETHPASVGSVEPLCEIQIRGADDQVLPDGEVGEICIRGACVFLGYWDNPTASAEVLDDQRWYRTGDFGRFHDGVLQLESRMRDLIIRGGENIYPIEIENRLIEHPSVSEVCVVGLPHHLLGQEVAAVVVVREGGVARRRRGAGVGRRRAGVVQGPRPRRVQGRAALQRHRQGAEERGRGRARGPARRREGLSPLAVPVTAATRHGSPRGDAQHAHGDRRGCHRGAARFSARHGRGTRLGSRPSLVALAAFDEPGNWKTDRERGSSRQCPWPDRPSALASRARRGPSAITTTLVDESGEHLVGHDVDGR